MVDTVTGIDFCRECDEMVEKNVYLDMTSWVDYLVKQPGFWDGDEDLPLTWDEIEYKVPDDEDEEYNTDWYCAFAVSSWLADELYEHGEMVSRVPGYPHIWLRGTFGQHISVDWVIEEIVRDWLVRLGRCTKEESKKLSIC